MGRVCTLIELGQILLDCQALSITVRCWSTFLRFLIVTCQFVMLKFCCASKIARASLRVENCARMLRVKNCARMLRVHFVRAGATFHAWIWNKSVLKGYTFTRIYSLQFTFSLVMLKSAARRKLRAQAARRKLRAHAARQKLCAHAARPLCARMGYFSDLNLE